MKYPFIITVALLLITPFYGGATDPNGIVPAQSVGLGGITTTLENGFSTAYNPATSGFIQNFSVGVAAQNLFSIATLNRLSAAFLLPTRSGNFGISALYYGFGAYAETKVNLSYSRAFGEKFALGVAFDYFNIRIDEYGSRHLPTFEIGFFYKALPKLYTGVHLVNPLRLELNDSEYEKYLATVLRFGLQYLPSKKVSLYAEVEKELEVTAVFKVGVEYRIVEKFYLQGGFHAYPYSGSFGASVVLKKLRIDIASSFQPTLGVSPSVGIQYIFSKKSAPTE